MLTQPLFGSIDPDRNRGRETISSTEQAIAMLHHVIADFESYFRALTADRRARPREDIATVLANATIDGGPIPDRELAGYYMIVATPGHDTPHAATPGARLGLAKDPAMFAPFPASGGDREG